MSVFLIKKFNKSLFNVISYVVIFMLVTIFLYYNFSQEKDISQNYYNDLYFDEDMARKNYQIDADIINSEDGDNLTDKEKKNLLAQSKLISKQKLDIFNSYQSTISQKEFLESEIAGLHNLDWASLKENKFIDDTLNIGDYILGKQLVNEYLIKNKLLLKSINHSTDSAIFTLNVLEFLNTPLFFALFFLLYLMEIFNKYENGKIKYLLTQPINRIDILISDLLSFIKKSGFIFIIVLVFSFISSLILSNEVTFHYPIIINALGKIVVLPLWKYFLILCITFFLLGITFFLLTYLVVILSKKAMVSVFLTLIISVSFNLWVKLDPKPYDSLNPFSYFNVEDVLKGNDIEDEINTVFSTNQNSENDFFTDEASLTIENSLYYSNASLANKTKAINIVMLALTLLLTIVISIIINGFILIQYKI